MKILFQNRPDALKNWGGDTTQMMETKRHLEDLGLTVDINLDLEPDLKGYDLVHIFNIQTADYGMRQLLNAKHQGIPVTLSTIYWDMRHIAREQERFLYHPSFSVRALAKIHVGIPYLISKLNFKRAYRTKKVNQAIKVMLQKADLILPNSHAELEILAQLFNMPDLRGKAVVVPNGVDPALKTATGMTTSLPGEYVLQVGRIETIKGQMKLIKALYDFPEIPLVFVGRVLEPYYAQECFRLGEKRGNTFFIDEVPHNQMPVYYAKARVHALPSLRESPGLVTLEAAIWGAQCVVSFHAPIAEYFGLDMFCCNPSDVDSIKKAVFKAWNSSPDGSLKERILNSFTWEEAARNTFKAYSYILDQR